MAVNVCNYSGVCLVWIEMFPAMLRVLNTVSSSIHLTSRHTHVSMRTGREQRRLPAMQQLHVDAAAGDQWRVTARRRRNNATDYSAPRSQRPAADRGDKCQMPSPSPRRFIVANHVPPMMAYVLLPPAIHSSLSLSPRAGWDYSASSRAPVTWT